MARGRKPKNSQGNPAAPAIDAERKVSSVSDEESGSGEVWDLTRVIPKSESVVCRVEGCKKLAVATWASNLKPNDTWNMCITCQENDFGGWPEGVEPTMDDGEDEAKSIEVPMEGVTTSIVDDNQSASQGKTSSPKPKLTNSSDSQSDLVKNDVNEDNESDEKWELKRILAIEAITKECPIKCSTEDCSLPACCVWVSSVAPTTNWYSCLDCQLKDFDGWPPLEELPVKSMTAEHKKAIASKCSTTKAPAMPVFPEPMANQTPPPTSLRDSHQEKAGSMVTPSPALIVQAKPSAAALAAHKKWQDEAEALNGPGARLVVGKLEAKKLIFDVVHDAFRPMTMADIHKALRALVPSPVLRSCLQDMTMDKDNVEDQFCDSDDDDKADDPAVAKCGRKSSAGPFAGSLAFKAGKSANSILYYTDHTKLQNNGDGLGVDERNELISKLAKVQAEKEALQARIEQLTAEASTLLAEPTNEQLIPQLEAEEPMVATLREKLESARLLKVNEKHRKQILKRVERMAAHWRKNKRLCMDFLIAMEDSTEGTVSLKKCLAGNGPIDIDSDEAIVASALAFQKKKSSSCGLPAKKKPKLKSSAGNETAAKGKVESLGLAADDNFVAVKLDATGSVIRVYADE